MTLEESVWEVVNFCVRHYVSVPVDYTVYCSGSKAMRCSVLASVLDPVDYVVGGISTHDATRQIKNIIRLYDT